MKELRFSTQIALHNNRKYSSEELKKKIYRFKRELNLKKIMFWANNDYRMYEEFIKICKEFDIESYLWYPVLSDVTNFDVKKEQLTVNFDGSYGYGKTFRWEKLGKIDENFLFLCPNNEITINKLFELYKKNLTNFDFNGVFLDRIRFPSPANGLESIFSCFCLNCKKKYHDLYGVSLDEIISLIRDFIKVLKNNPDCVFRNCTGFESIIEYIGIKDFINFKEISIYKIVKMYSDYAKFKLKKVGLDLFTISLSNLVSQNYCLLSNCCDWIKPMMYCHATVPAGIPLEVYCIFNYLKKIGTGNNDEELPGKLSKSILGIDLPLNFEEILIHGIDEKFISAEFNKIKKQDCLKKKEIYPGIEAVRIPGLCKISESMIRKYFMQLHNKSEEFILSWNLIDIPDSFLKVIHNFLN
ncbi:MAG: hypothetical protein PHQ09_05520 [Actinomycetota bacterium]|nr:hypothetical protein [Actinomycetota bacterium]